MSARLSDFPNNDRVFHNVFSFKTVSGSTLGCTRTAPQRITFDKPGLTRLFCNIHPNMAAYVMAVDSPYFAVSNESGTFTIEDVPPGTYTYHAWRPGGQPLTWFGQRQWNQSSGSPLVGSLRASFGVALVSVRRRTGPGAEHHRRGGRPYDRVFR